MIPLAIIGLCGVDRMTHAVCRDSRSLAIVMAVFTLETLTLSG